MLWKCKASLYSVFHMRVLCFRVNCFLMTSELTEGKRFLRGSGFTRLKSGERQTEQVSTTEHRVLHQVRGGRKRIYSTCPMLIRPCSICSESHIDTWPWRWPPFLCLLLRSNMFWYHSIYNMAALKMSTDVYIFANIYTNKTSQQNLVWLQDHNLHSESSSASK